MPIATKNKAAMTIPATAAPEKPSEGEASNDEVGVDKNKEEEEEEDKEDGEAKVVLGGKLVATVSSVICEDGNKLEVVITTSFAL